MKKAITPVISIIILLLITISLSGMGWTYMSGYYEAMTAKQIKVVEGSAYGNEITLMNIGTADITESDLKVLVNGRDSGIVQISPGTIEPKKSGRIVFEFSGLGRSDVRIMAPGSALSYSHDIKLDELHNITSWWKFDDTGGKDSAGSNDGTVYGAEVAQGLVGNALYFDGVGTQDYVMVPDDDTLDIANDITIDMLLKLGPYDSDYADQIMNKAGSTTNAMIVWYYFGATSGAPGRLAPYSNISGTWGAAAGFYPAEDSWYHIALTYDGSAFRAYMNGTETGAWSRSGGIMTNNEPLYIGRGWHGTADCTIDEVRIWDRALSGDEIKALHSMV